MEEWKQIIEYPNYSISNFGNVRNDKTGKILKQDLNTYGYSRVTLYAVKKKKNLKIHRLVGFAFLNNDNNYKEIDHINNDKLNNKAENLRWVTREFNNRNRKKWGNTTSRYKGVCFSKRDKKWISNITVNTKLIHLGYFKTENEAGLAYNNYITNNNLEYFILNEIIEEIEEIEEI
jgi:hypothetical protein